MQSRAAVLHAIPATRPYAQSRPLVLETVELDPPGPGEVLVRIAAAGLCHSDLSVINGDRPRPVPMALGHEASGIVERLGDGVTDLRPGDHVVMVFVPSCGHCAPCAEGRPALCEPGAKANASGELLAGGRRIHLNGAPVSHHIGVSAFGEFAVVSRRSLVPIDREVPLDHAALFGCAVLTGVGAVVNTAAIRPGQTVAVIGLGGVGLSAVLGALGAGAAEIIAIDVNPDKLAIARELGATAVFDAADPDTSGAVRERTRGGVHAAIETAGVPAAFDLAYQVTRRGGQTVTASLANPAARLSLQQVGLVAEERTIRGSYLGGGVPSRDIPAYIALFRQGRLPVDRLLTSSGPLDDINAAFDSLAEGKTVRHIIRMEV
ncbi:zinc-dependent alcohol dehydrogenase family protein [Aurantimonas sp. VKM B-3413]|uniref:zinc-dependent alcohol dehydrogenase family protein n=1 Tax=Aurantimonas sp. VKM B-3413 TaxID=2779401 RepID=UPI001E62E89F|nr:zinc-dependent alcohol dehydrogenase family protein [Aurantimonas sp. VKM B-3413]MCB8837948.1 zinc-dependent alcohol dehydrogenase family protein [Aurantimonas sp. VKM B-3413]